MLDKLFAIIRYCGCQGFEVSYADFEKDTACSCEVNLTLMYLDLEEE